MATMEKIWIVIEGVGRIWRVLIRDLFLTGVSKSTPNNLVTIFKKTLLIWWLRDVYAPPPHVRAVKPVKQVIHAYSPSHKCSLATSLLCLFITLSGDSERAFFSALFSQILNLFVLAKYFVSVPVSLDTTRNYSTYLVFFPSTVSYFDSNFMVVRHYAPVYFFQLTPHPLSGRPLLNHVPPSRALFANFRDRPT